MSGPGSGTPWTVEDLAKPPEAEPGREIQLCPIRQLPIVPSLRVRALPGFHLLSLDAGKEALARGSYTAFGRSFQCQILEYLHSEDKVFICAEDNKAFLNEMSMRYHRYIGHELKERKAERKRLRERAEERKVRSAAHQAAQREAALRPAVQEPAAAPVAEPAPAAAPAPAPVPVEVPAVAPVVAEATPASPPGLGAQPSAADAAATFVAEEADRAGMEATDDPYAAGDMAEDPYEVPAEPELVADANETVDPAPVAAAPASTPVAAAAPASAVAAPAPALAAAPPAAAAAGGGEDLYGDMGEREGKRQKSASTYASAIGAIMGNDFDDED